MMGKEQRGWIRHLGDEQTLRWGIWIGLFVVLWTVEWTAIQTLTIPVRPITRHYLLIPAIRAGFNGLWAIVMVLLIPRLWGLILLTLSAGISALGLVAYSQYFKSPLANIESVGLLFGATGRAIPSVVSDVSALVWVGLAVVGAIQVYLLWKAQPFAPGWTFRWRGVGLAVVAGVLLIFGLQWTTYSFERIAVQPFSRRIYAYGYLISWGHKAYLRADSEHFLNQAKEDFFNYTDQAILEREDKKKIASSIVIIQVESLGFEIMGHRVVAGEVVPFLNHLKATSLFYRIRAFHNYGTGEMDFACLAGGRPSTEVMNYQLPEFEYPRSLPLFLKKQGYQTMAYHGNSGEFFNRRPAFQKMKFDRLGFKEDLNQAGLKSSYWGIRDLDLLLRVAMDIRSATGRYFAFVITLDSHVPFDLIQPDEEILFPGTRDTQERYLNSIHWADQALKQFYEALPTGTTLLIYGDHPAHSDTDETGLGPEPTAEYVPAFLHRKGEDWGQSQKERLWSQQTDALSLLDVMAYIRACVDGAASDGRGGE